MPTLATPIASSKSSTPILSSAAVPSHAVALVAPQSPGNDRTDRRHLRWNLLWGGLAIAVIAVSEALGLLVPLDRSLADWRCRLCQHFAPPPTEVLIHVDIDDMDLESIGPWPWPRARIAGIIDEIHRAGAKAIAVDVLLPEQ